MLTAILIFVIILSVIIFVHELGHFSSARRFGVRVEEFGFGFPPRIKGIKRGDTIYSINWIPFGGFVKLKGEQGDDKEANDSFAHKPIWQRSIIMSSGVGMNVILAMILMMITFAVGVPSVVDENTKGTIKKQAVQVLEIEPDSPAAEADIISGDKIISINGTAIQESTQVSEVIGKLNGEAAEITIERGQEEKVLMITPVLLDDDATPKIGVSLFDVGIVTYPWHQAISEGFKGTFVYIWEIAKGFAMIIKDLVVTHKVSVDIAGPVGIAVLTGQVAKMGFIYIINFVILLSLTLAVINILPLPALDGGRLFFLLIEKLRGRPVDQKIEGVVHGIGFYLLILLLIVISFRDVQRFEIGDKIGNFFSNIF